ncbi:helix-turn-helix transcriptional regulator [Lysinibacillus boronitolerans]|uniref:XRE family transcriptional regulator n=1 Tax=Lysinibacillus boronitolerans JCM 21713 = 10a = NBRC 103108 TaxID=1294264 RepID=A0ABR4Y4T4_9BACI|nr:helix-turn-helix transcriptional regulator [Lysinibacillus boronitolerans]KGR88836.1 XRE family transcriptional regulator [Lysinibacillus boronitolerans JCM 21713 = 10a = NBRC 103108]
MRYWLKEIRVSKRKTQFEIADSSGISRSYYTKIELGIKTPTVDVAKKIAATLGFDWTIFFEDKCSLKEHKKAI